MPEVYVERMPLQMLWYAGYHEKRRLVQAMRKAVGEESYSCLLLDHRSTRVQRVHDPRLKTATRHMKSTRAHGRDSSQQTQSEAMVATKKSRAMVPVQGYRPDMSVGMRFGRLEYRSCFDYFVGMHWVRARWSGHSA
jgi:hypothetical protein